MSYERAAAALTYILIKQQRRDEWEERMWSNISRWENSLRKLENAEDSIHRNLHDNKERLSKAQNFLDRLLSRKSLDWYERSQVLLSGDRLSPEKRSDLQHRVDQYEEKRVSVENRIRMISCWINDGHRSLSEINSKQNSLRDKISSVRSKL